MGRSPTAVPTCQGTLAPLTLLQPFLPPWLGSSWRRVPLEGDHEGEGPAASVVRAHVAFRDHLRFQGGLTAWRFLCTGAAAHFYTHTRHFPYPCLSFP